jgi:hypothetical protein
MEFHFRGGLYDPRRGAFRCYLIVKVDSPSYSAAKMMLVGSQNASEPKLKWANGDVAHALKRYRFPIDGSYGVFVYYTPANHVVRGELQARLYRQINSLRRQFKPAKRRKKGQVIMSITR